MTLSSIAVFEKLTGWANRSLSEKQFTALRNRYLAMRAMLSPVSRLAHGSFNADDLARHLRERVGTDYEILMVHSSVNSMQPMFTGTAIELVRMLITFCGTDRTLAMPAFYFGDPGTSGAYESLQRRPMFDVVRTQSQMGLATEIFRRTKGVMHSRHPVFRTLALGPLAGEITRGHELATTPCGPGTPFDYMARHETQIIGIGKSIEVLTQVHHAEDVMGEAFPVPAKTAGTPLDVSLIDAGQVIPFQLRGRSFLWQRNMGKLRSIMRPDALKEWRFHGVPMFTVRARDVTDSLIKVAGQGRTLYEKP